MATSPAPKPLINPLMPIQAKLAFAWTSLMFLYIYVDYYHLHKPSVLDNIQAGLVFEFPITAPLLTGFLIVTGIPSVMILLSAVLPARANRITNIIAGILYIPATVFNAVGETWEWAPFYVVSIGVELVLIAYILRSTWMWPRVATAVPDASLVDAR